MKSYGRCLFCFLGLVVLVLIGSNPVYATWKNVYPGPDPEATRAYIQAVIDAAHNGDVIYFNRGTYDFSGAPADTPALLIPDKSLIIKGAPGSIIVGAANFNPDTGERTGNYCFSVVDSDANKDVVFDGLTMQTFVFGIDSSRWNDDPNNFFCFPNLRNLTINNCTFQDIKGWPVSCYGVQGNLTISNNRFYGDRSSADTAIAAMWLDLHGNKAWQPDNTLITITNNIIVGFNAQAIYTNRTSKMLITRNTITESGYGIIVDWGAKTETTISYNTLSEQHQGIGLYSGLELVNGVLVESPTRRVTITHNNLIHMRDYGILMAGGISYSNLVAFNRVNVTNDTGWGPALCTQGHDEQFRNNVITGYNPWWEAICLLAADHSDIGAPIEGPHHELFVNNSVSGFTQPGPSYYLDPYTHDNLVIGIPTEHATYQDDGVNNTFKLVYPLFSSSAKMLLMSPNSTRALKRPEMPKIPRRIR
jgi:hypothetical protein